MANGNVVRLPRTPEISAPQSFAPQLGGAEGWIDAIIIELVDVCVQGVREIDAGGLDPATRLQGGDLIARLCVLQGKIGQREFAAAMHRVGQTRRGAPLGAAVINDIVDVVAEVPPRSAR